MIIEQGAKMVTTRTKTSTAKIAESVDEPDTAKIAEPESTADLAQTAEPATIAEDGETIEEQAAPDLSEIVKQREFLLRVAARTGLRAQKVRPVLDAAMDELGRLLSQGHTLQHPSLGKLSVNRKREMADVEVLICKLGRKVGEKSSGRTNCGTG